MLIETLEADHRKVEDLFAEYKTKEHNSEKLHVVKQIIHELTVHAEAEEAFVYPLLLEHEDHGEDKELYHHSNEEHTTIKNILHALEGTVSHFDGSMEDLEAAVKHHVEEEETKVFPVLANEFADRLDAAAEDFKRFKAEKPFA